MSEYNIAGNKIQNIPNLFPDFQFSPFLTGYVRKIRRYLVIVRKIGVIFLNLCQGRDEMTFRFDVCISTLFSELF